MTHPARSIPRLVFLMLVTVVTGCTDHRAVMDDTAHRALIIAHRGASGYLPEHTLAAYALAYGQGADLIEPDVVMSRDGVLICSHDLTADATSDVAERFPGRTRPDGRHYLADLTLAEIKQLSKRGRGDRQPEGDAFRGYPFATLDEMIQLVQTLNVRTGRRVGIIPEPKSPKFHRENGMPIEEPLVRALAAHGYIDHESPAIIQCFDIDALRRIRFELGCKLRLAYTCGEPLDELALADAATFVDAIGPNRKLIEPGQGRTAPAVDVLAFAREHGLETYPWTFDDEPDAVRRFSRVYRVSGMFINFPDIGVRER